MSETPPTPQGKAVLQTHDLHRWLGSGANRVHALRGASLSIHSRHSYAIVGPSGCGKSTLLYLLGLLDQPDQGSILMDDTDFARADDRLRTSTRNRKIGFVFQFHFLLAEFSALENILLPMRKLGLLSESEMRQRATSLLAQVGLADKAGRRANQLSGGEQQRVAIARALANRPALILADEPTGNLDAENSTRVFKLLQKIAREEGPAIVMVTHNPDLARQADHTLAMRDGQFIDNKAG